MYRAEPDPYCYPGTTILINRLGTRNQAELDAFETEMTSDKGGNAFCYPEHIDREMRRIFGELAWQKKLTGVAAGEFARETAHFLAGLNAVHPFREGNGRTQLSFLTILAERAGHPLDLDRLEPKAMLKATIASFVGSEKPLAGIIYDLILDPESIRKPTRPARRRPPAPRR